MSEIAKYALRLSACSIVGFRPSRFCTFSPRTILPIVWPCEDSMKE